MRGSQPEVVSERDSGELKPQAETDEAILSMARFAEHTGLEPDGADCSGRRYLWTDAFAVCNWLALWKRTGDERYLDLSLRMVDCVHHGLGQHRPDDPRRGWISGLDAQEAGSHPLRGGLRIGKPLPERGLGEAINERLEGARDGQYFHCLTKWMRALDQLARWTHREQFNRWGRELADTAHRAFVYGPRGEQRMFWKMSTDLSHPLVWSMGQLDPLEGLVACTELRATASALGSTSGPDLREASRSFASMIDGQNLWTADPLGIGGLLSDGFRLVQASSGGAHSHLIRELLVAARAGIDSASRRGEWRQPASRRVAFRELGLAVGLLGFEFIEHAPPGNQDGALDDPAVRAQLQALAPHVPLGRKLRSFWLDPEHRRSEVWTAHRDLNEVMLATSLVPEGYLGPSWRVI